MNFLLLNILQLGWDSGIYFNEIYYLFNLQIYITENDITIQKQYFQGLYNRQNSIFCNTVAMIAKINIINNNI